MYKYKTITIIFYVLLAIAAIPATPFIGLGILWSSYESMVSRKEKRKS